MKAKKLCGFLLLLLLLCAASAAFSDSPAAELTGACTFSSNNVYKTDIPLMTDGSVSTSYALKEKNGWLEIGCDTPVCGLSVSVLVKSRNPWSYSLEAMDENGQWQAVAQSRYLTDWFDLSPGYTRLRIRSTGRERLRIAELRAFGPGEKPDDVQNWQDLDKCDLMLLACHPDDEVLWFAGLLPTYAGEREYKVQLAMMTPDYGDRQLELLRCAWHCGVRYYPYFIGFHDKHGGSVEKQLTQWNGKNKVLKEVVQCIRRFRPEVLVTHGEDGEYGHSAHRVTAWAAKECFSRAADEKQFSASADQYGTWQVKKLYLHEYGENRITMDWNRPLSAFGGKTGFDVAEEAYQFHATQVAIGHYEFERGPEGSHDNTAFGLYATVVGPDEAGNDFMEHIVLPDSVSAQDHPVPEETVFPGGSPVPQSEPDAPAAVPMPAPAGDNAPSLNEAGFLDQDEPYVYASRETGEWTYISRDIHVEIRQRSDTTPHIWLEAFVRYRDPAFFGAMVNESTEENPTKSGTFLSKPTAIAGQHHAVFAVSDDFFGYRLLNKQKVGIVIRNGRIWSDSTRKASGKVWPPLDVLALFADGRMQTYDSDAYTAGEYLEMGVVSTFAFGPVLVRNGAVCDDLKNWRTTDRAPRMALGVCPDGTVVALDAFGRRKDAVGVTTPWLAEKLVELGASEAINLDGGNTTCMIFMGDVINRPEGTKDKNLRTVNGLIGVREGGE